MNTTEQAMGTIATKLSTTTEEVWAGLIRQAPINSTIELIWFTSFAALLLLGFRKCTRHKRKNTQAHQDGTNIFVFLCLSFLTFIWCFCFAMSLGRIIAGYNNPAYRAVMDLVK